MTMRLGYVNTPWTGEIQVRVVKYDYSDFDISFVNWSHPSWVYQQTIDNSGHWVVFTAISLIFGLNVGHVFITFSA